MDCRAFRNKHVAFVDDLLSSVEMDAMWRHLHVCPRCSRHDTVIRRSLLLVRNLPTIEPSPDFMARLNSRIQALGPYDERRAGASEPFIRHMTTVIAVAASFAAIGYIALQTTRYFSAPSEVRPPAVVASAPEVTPVAIPNAAFVASVPTGIPVWPAVIMAGEAPLHFASMEFRDGR